MDLGHQGPRSIFKMNVVLKWMYMYVGSDLRNWKLLLSEYCFEVDVYVCWEWIEEFEIIT